MSLIEGIGDEVTQFFLILITALVAYVAWWSTNISEQRQVRTVLLLDRRRLPTRSILRVRVPSRQLSNHTETVTISEGTPSNSSTSIQTEESPDSEITTNISDSPQTSSAQPKSSSAPSVSSASQTTLEDSNSEQAGRAEDSFISTNIDTIDLEEESDIIETMDADTQNELRQRRLAHFEGTSTHGSASNQFNENNATNSNLESIDSTEEPKTVNITQQEGDPKSPPNDTTNNITIKLKYINDDIRAVDGRLEELLGDFKRRHFVEELNANKAIKLIFNGHVLKQDRQSLQSCGFFDNCVVHCLIHQKRPSVIEREGRDANEANPSLFGDNPFVRVTNVNNNNQGIDWDLGNFLFALVSFILLAAWYFRYVYAHLYTVTATVGLIIITGVFSIVLLGAYFPDNELQDANLRIRITRTERMEVQEQPQQ